MFLLDRVFNRDDFGFISIGFFLLLFMMILMLFWGIRCLCVVINMKDSVRIIRLNIIIVNMIVVILF